MRIKGAKMSGDGHKKKFDLKIIRDEIGNLHGEKINLSNEVDKLETYLREQNGLVDAKEQQIAKAARQINDLISLIRDKVILIRRLQSQIDWMHNRLVYKFYRRASGLLKIFQKIK